MSIIKVRILGVEKYTRRELFRVVAGLTGAVLATEATKISSVRAQGSDSSEPDTDATSTTVPEDAEPAGVNPEMAPESITVNGTFEGDLGWSYERNGETVFFRRLIDQRSGWLYDEGLYEAATVIDDSIEATANLGTISIERPQTRVSDNLHHSDRLNYSINERGRENLVNGVETYFLLGYQQVYGVSEAEAQTMLEANEELPISWQTNLQNQRGALYISPNSEDTYVRNIRPQSGVSFIIIDDNIPYTRRDDSSTQLYPNLGMSYVTAAGEHSPVDWMGYTFGVDAEANGRLAIYVNRGISTNGVSVSGTIVYAVEDALRYTRDVVENPEFIHLYREGQRNWRLGGRNRDRIYEAFGYPNRDAEDVTDWSEFSSIDVNN